MIMMNHGQRVIASAATTKMRARKKNNRRSMSKYKKEIKIKGKKILTNLTMRTTMIRIRKRISNQTKMIDRIQTASISIHHHIQTKQLASAKTREL